MNWRETAEKGVEEERTGKKSQIIFIGHVYIDFLVCFSHVINPRTHMFS